MRAARVPAALGLLGVAAAALSGCSLEESLAYHVDGDTIDIAFCEEFSADSVTIEFGDYRRILTTTATRVYSGPSAMFGRGVPISTSMQGWSLAPDGDPVPQHWDRIDFSFYEHSPTASLIPDDGVSADVSTPAGSEYVSGEYLFHDEVRSTAWAWRRGRGIKLPDCTLDLG
ncbi:hypothetical protein GCM10027515_28700 [Schumannella luteola]|uniref:Uncharacterized protein n=1 Tax=Schumannella luteola TaxID=472059 RepID=A0A852YDU9_9MICO|nr:hypothetical protein [Schumannella luteola]NYG99331.1 hypothetical protein [Schumannella luteola]TPX06062.1 hypothetical protein FJ656_02710 [Schumannella luteola]